MLEFFDSSAKLVGHSGSILLPDEDEITHKLAMLFEGQCEGLGPTRAARKFGYTKQRYFQLLEQFEAQGALALQSKARGPKTNYRRTEEMVRLIIRHRFLDPDASAEVVPLHAIRGGFLTVITTDVLNGIGVLAGFKCLLVKCWEFGRVLGAGGRKPPWPADAGSGVERASMAGDRWVWSKRSRRMAHCAVGLC